MPDANNTTDEELDAADDWRPLLGIPRPQPAADDSGGILPQHRASVSTLVQDLEAVSVDSLPGMRLAWMPPMLEPP